jgi:formamidopyrimidine-DNA glycosylase
MPELPEVEVVRSGLEPVIRGALIDRVRVLDDRSLKRHLGSAEDFAQRLTGAQVLGALRRGKFLWFPLADCDEALVCHLGMSGQVLVGAPGSSFGSHLRIQIDVVTTHNIPWAVGFVDQRIFGSMALDVLVPTPDGFPGGLGSSEPFLPASVTHIARDPLDPHFDDRAWSVRLRSTDRGIKRALLDQTLVSGIGNIYADEALWACSLHYATPSSRLTNKRALVLLEALRVVLRKALGEGGTSFDQQYVNVNGQSGYFSHSLQAYGRQGQACSRCGSIIRREPFMNRSSHRCPKCQRTPVGR